MYAPAVASPADRRRLRLLALSLPTRVLAVTTTMALSPAAVEWLIAGEQGISSRAIFNRLHFGWCIDRYGSDYPHDPDDFRRCERLLREVPTLRSLMPLMADHHPTWRRLVERWDDIVTTMEADLPGVFDGAHGRCDTAYALMKTVIYGDRP